MQIKVSLGSIPGRCVPGRMRHAEETIQSERKGTAEIFWTLTALQNYRTEELFGLERAFKYQRIQPPCHRLGCLSLAHVAQSPIQPDLEHLQCWSIHNLPGQPIPVSHHHHCKKCSSLYRI